jgi:hypothetical protein
VSDIIFSIFPSYFLLWVAATSLAAMVGLKVPGMRLVEYVSEEWLQIKESLHTFSSRISTSSSSSAEESQEFSSVAQKLRSELNRPFFLVMDFVRGQPLECNYRLPALLESHASKDLFVSSFGSMMAFDILINNSDRVPIIHSNEGNASNILITEEGACIPIDTCLTSIHPMTSSRLLERYLQKLEALLPLLCAVSEEDDHSALSEEESAQARAAVIQRLEPVRDFLWRATAHRVSDEICLLIGRELLRGVRKIAAILTTTEREDQSLTTPAVLAEEGTVSLRRFRELKERVAGLVTEDWELVWERSLQLVNVEFLEHVLDAFLKHSRPR